MKAMLKCILFSLVSSHQSTSIHINPHQSTSIHINPHQSIMSNNNNKVAVKSLHYCPIEKLWIGTVKVRELILDFCGKTQESACDDMNAVINDCISYQDHLSNWGNH